MNENYIIKLIDGGLVNVESDDWHYPGCETCDYGSSYTNKLTLVLTKHTVEITFNQMYEYGFSSSDTIKMFAEDFSSMTEDEFINHIRLKCEEYNAFGSFDVSNK